MLIGVDIRHAIGQKTGKGFYILKVLQSLLTQDKENQYLLYSDADTEIFENYKNAELKIIKVKGILWHLKVFLNLKNDKIDLFWAPTSYIIPFLIGKKLPYVITVHDIVAFLFPSFHNKKAILIEKLTLKRSIKYAKKIFVVSESTGKDLINYFKISKDKLLVTYNSVVPSTKYEVPSTKYQVRSTKYQVPSTKYQVPSTKYEVRSTKYQVPSTKYEVPSTKYQVPSTKYILTIGTLEPRKNHIRLIQAFDSIKNEFPDLQLWIGGGNGWSYEKIFEEVEKRNLVKRVKFLAYVDEQDLPKLYENAELFAFPSLYEGFGIPIIEAMSYGCPVLTSDNSAMTEVSGDAAILVNALQTDEIADALRKILKDEKLRKDLIGKGFKNIKRFSWDQAAENILKNILKF